ncbi:MAG: hypothetical protein F6K47_14655 [Symploca sp. SIO2E6]|nr:hypothetical protein [Symploca sp. SIO2E6]
MKFEQYRSLLPIALVALILTSDGVLGASSIDHVTPANPSEQILHQGTAYFCDEDKKLPTLVARSDLGNVPIIEFKTDFSELTSLERCREITKRLLKFHREKNLRYLTWERLPNGGRVINVAQHEGDLFRSPEYVDLLFTLKPDDIVHEILEDLQGIASSFGGSPISN